MTATSVEGAPTEPAEIEAFLGRLTDIYAGSMLTYMIDVGYRTGRSRREAGEYRAVGLRQDDLRR